MDEAEAQVALDLSGRAFFVWEGKFNRERVGELPTELVPALFPFAGGDFGRGAAHQRARRELPSHDRILFQGCGPQSAASHPYRGQ